MSQTTIEVLTRLKKKMSRERSRYGQIENHATSNLSKERAHGERAVCGFVIALLDQEIRALDKSE